jgi:DNA-binding response OmpR family regulator
LKHVNLNGMVWLVDDDKLIMQLCSLVLQKHHIAHICFDTAEDVLHQTTEEAPEIIIMDIRMPKISGIELCKAVREKYGEKIKIVALTAHVLPEEKKELLESGFDHVLTKPFREIEMITLLTKYLHDEGQNQVEETENKNSNDAFDAFLHSLTEEEKMLIIPQFINESNDDLRQLENGIADADPTKIFETLHRLAGRLLQVGATTYGSKARKLESYMHSHENEMPIEEILTLKKHIAAMIEALEVPTV